MNNDLYFLRHIVDEVRFLKTYCRGLPKSKLIYDEMLRKAVQKSLENISVAAFNLSPDLKDRYIFDSKPVTRNNGTNHLSNLWQKSW